MALKAAQQGARLADDEASALVKDAARARVEGLLDAAVKCIRQRSRVRDYTGTWPGWGPVGPCAWSRSAQGRRGRRGKGSRNGVAGELTRFSRDVSPPAGDPRSCPCGVCSMLLAGQPARHLLLFCCRGHGCPDYRH